MQNKKVLIIGEIFVDMHLDKIERNKSIVRLGGIFHSARGFDAADINYGLAYYAPSYLKNDVDYFSCKLNSKGSYQLGVIDRCPNIMLIAESKEIGDQGYCNILNEQAEIIGCESLAEVVEAFKPTDILIYPGKYSTCSVLEELATYDVNIHIDFHYDSETLIKSKNFKIDTVIISTSSLIFKDVCKGTYRGTIDYFSSDICNKILIKENRGGSCVYLHSEKMLYESPAYYIPIVHSVGVGDCFNAVFIGYNRTMIDNEKRLKLSAMFSSLYASTLDHRHFKQAANSILSKSELVKLDGIRLSWEERESKSIYIAAPDFPDVDTKLLDLLSDSLKYHNFRVHLPVRENGLINENSTYEEECKTYQKDVELINNCDLLIAVLLYNDPGTLVELGMFKQSKKPTVVFDPYDICNNMFLKHTPNYLCKTLGEVVDATFECFRRR